MQIILASNSPRRRELLAQDNVEFTVIPSTFEEKGEGLPAKETVSRFAEGKAREVYSRFPDRIVLGADTVVSFEGKILGKPRSPEEAKEMLRCLSGKTHAVYTGVCIIKDGKEFHGVEETKVTFNPLSEHLIEEYVASGLPLDKAGAYGIQDGYPLVQSYEGSYTNVMGLPMELVRKLMKEGEIC